MSAIILPPITHFRRIEHGALFTLQISPELYYFRGHFPEVPLLPGVVQLAWAVELARSHLQIKGEFQSLLGVKFMRVIQPNTIIELHLEQDTQANSFEFEYRIEPHSYAVGIVRFTA